jgi:replication factor C large subunit
MGPWIRKYSPKKINEVIAQDSVISLLKSFVENFKNQKKKAVLVYGPSGIGKTSSIYALANELNLEIIEMNASDFRNKEQINSVAGAASQQMSLFGKSKLILIDELDGVAGRQDFGGIKAIENLIAETKFPLIMTANDPFDKKFSSVRKKTEMLQFKLLEVNDIYKILKNICDNENIKYQEDILKKIARRNGGDARAAVNDLQILAGSDKMLMSCLKETSLTAY